MKKDIAQKLLELRTSRALSLRQMAELTGINHNVIHKWETAKTTPNRSSVIKLAKTFNVKATWLLFGEDNMSERKLQDDFNVLTERSQKHVEALIALLLELEQLGGPNGNKKERL